MNKPANRGGNRGSRGGNRGRKGSRRVRTPRRRGSMGFSMVLTGIVLLGVGMIVISKDDRSEESSVGPAIGDHWHAVLGINICGVWQPDVPEYESAKGIHSHGDGYIHMHPFGSAGAHKNATVGLFLEQADYEVTDESLKVPDQKIKKNGDKCEKLDDQAAGLRWSVNGQDKPLGTDPADYVPNNGDVVAIAFLPEKEPIGTPPAAAKEPVNDGAPSATTTTVPGAATETTATTAPAGATTTTAGSGATTTTAKSEDPTTTTKKG